MTSNVSSHKNTNIGSIKINKHEQITEDSYLLAVDSVGAAGGEGRALDHPLSVASHPDGRPGPAVVGGGGGREDALQRAVLHGARPTTGGDPTERLDLSWRHGRRRWWGLENTGGDEEKAHLDHSLAQQTPSHGRLQKINLVGSPK